MPRAPADNLEQKDRVQGAWHILCGRDHNPDTGGHRQEWQHPVGGTTPAPLPPASGGMAIGEEAGLTGWAKYMRARYRL